MKKHGKVYTNTIDKLSENIQALNNFFLKKAQQQVNTALTIRNWIIGFYMVEYELHGSDRAQYGAGIYKMLAERLLQNGVKSLRERHLYLCKDLYLGYPGILRTLSAKSYLMDFKSPKNLLTVSAKLNAQQLDFNNILLSSLSFSHFIELLKVEPGARRLYYEEEAIRNGWSVRLLKRAIESMLYERTGLSSDKQAVKQKFENEAKYEPEALFRNTYLLEFLGLEEKATYSESDLEDSIITNLQKFLVELGKGFCFEARQKRITFGNTHYWVDLVFYHRILKCHVLLDLKIGEFEHSDAGQMNMYLNYYKDNEFTSGDNNPIGIILCSGRNEALVKYATMGLPQQIFVSKYLVNLPSEEELQKIIQNEKERRLYR